MGRAGPGARGRAIRDTAEVMYLSRFARGRTERVTTASLQQNYVVLTPWVRR
jgi:hypothetical protein